MTDFPTTSGGFAVRFATTHDPVVRHRVEVTALGSWFARVLGAGRSADQLSLDDWLAVPTQVVRSLTAGAVHHDPHGEIEAQRAALAWYPDDLWRYVLACQWHRIAQHEPFIGRAAEIDDRLGGALVSARLGRDLVRLAFLVERVWAPYDKWLGVAFRDLDAATVGGPAIRQMLSAGTREEREEAYLVVVTDLATRCNRLGLIEPVGTDVRRFHSRPFLVLDADRFAEPLLASSGLAGRGWFGSVDQWSDNVDLVTSDRLALRRLPADDERSDR